jgi:DNA-binding SARP family transcriptional activator/tetratricopeptide (TPR) repeat protein
MLSFRILGPIECYAGERRCELGGPRQLALLAMLLLHANRAVSADHLNDALWGEQRSQRAAKRLQMAITRLRKSLGGSGADAAREPVLRTVSGGYLLTVRPGELDADVFQARVQDGRQALTEGDPARAGELLRNALDLWRGPVLAEVAYADFAQSAIRRLEELRLAALEARVDADLRLGRHVTLIGELDALVAEHRLRERLHGQRMLALYRCGRQAEALEAYHDARRVLIDEIGLEPGPALQHLHEAILHHEVSLERNWAGDAPGAPPALARHRPRLPRALAAAAASPFVGRDQELARLQGAWARGARAVIVAGEAGIGKTRLAAELARTVDGDAALVLYGRCDEALAVPYQPFVQALRPPAEALGLERVRAELGRLAPELARLLPEFDALGEPLQADPETERFMLFEAVTALVAAVTRERRALLVLDDLHWAAQPTLLMLRHVIRSEQPHGALLLGTCRETEVAPDHPVVRLLADLQRDAGATSVRIGGLDEHAIGALLEATAGHTLDERAADFARLLRSETGGNPFFIREVLAHLVEAGTIFRAGERWTTDLHSARLEVPEGLRHVIRARVGRLSAPAQRALALAAVAGPIFSLAVLERVPGEPAGLLDGLDEAIAAGLVAETGPGEYAFAHALVRQSIYEGHSSARRMRMHRRLGEAIEALPDADAHVEALAHHFAESAADGQAAKAAAYAVSAGRKASARLAYEDAAAHYEHGLKALELTATRDDARRGELLLALGDARWNSGQINKARQACRRAAELADDRGDVEQLAHAALTFAGPLRLEVTPAVTEPLIDLLERALHALGESESALRARVLARLSAALAYANPSKRVPHLARDALVMARRFGDKRAVAEVLAAMYVATRGPDNVAERAETAAELAHIAAELGDRRLGALARSWITTSLIERGDIDAATREVAALHHEAEAYGQRFPRFLAAIARASSAYLEGRLAAYEALTHEVLALGLEGEDESATHAVAAQMLFLRREQGQLGELVESIEDFADRYPQIPAWRYALAWTYAELGRPTDARRELDALGRNDFSDLPRDWVWLMSISIVSEVVVFLDDSSRAEVLYELLLPYADRILDIDVGFCLGSASRPLGLLSTTTGRFDAAARHFEHALALNAKLRSPLWVAHTQHDYARLLVRRDRPGDREHALTLLRAALATAGDLGLKALADKALRLKGQAETLTVPP